MGLFISAPRAGFEPATWRLQGPLRFQRAWTISSPSSTRPRRVSGAVRAYWLRSSSLSLCTFPLTHYPHSASFAQGDPPTKVRASLNSPDFSIPISRESCKKLQPPALPTELPGNLLLWLIITVTQGIFNAKTESGRIRRSF